MEDLKKENIPLLHSPNKGIGIYLSLLGSTIALSNSPIESFMGMDYDTGKDKTVIAKKCMRPGCNNYAEPGRSHCSAGCFKEQFRNKRK